MLLLDALYINNSGGKVLLDLLVEALYATQKEVYYLLDERCKGDYPYLPENNVCYLKATITNRKIFYKQKGNTFKKVLCFGNIPPTRPLKATVYTYFHNINLLTQPQSLTLKAKLLLRAKGLYIQFLKKNTDIWLVQSENMQSILKREFKIDETSIEIYPFYKPTEKIEGKRPSDSYFYISNGNPHKNHKTLLDAWEILFSEGKNFQLSLTVTDAYPQLKSRINQLKAKGLMIENHGWVKPEELYKSHQYLIYPSLAESFGLALVEAIEAGCEVIGAELPYTYAVVKPLATFDPLSAKNIAEIVAKSSEYKMHSSVVVKNRIAELITKLAH